MKGKFLIIAIVMTIVIVTGILHLVLNENTISALSGVSQIFNKAENLNTKQNLNDKYVGKSLPVQKNSLKVQGIIAQESLNEESSYFEQEPIQKESIVFNNPNVLSSNPRTCWNKKLTELENLFGSSFLDIDLKSDRFMRGVSVWKEADITGDCISDVLVSLGNAGASTTNLTLVRMENNKPVIAKFKTKEGKVASLLFTEGASLLHGSDVVLLPEKNAIYQGHWMKNAVNPQVLDECDVEVYQWNAKTKIFEFNSQLSKEIEGDYCTQKRNESIY